MAEPKAASLEVELLSSILGYLEDSPHSLAAASLVNQHWHWSADVVGLRHQSLDFTASEEPQYGIKDLVKFDKLLGEATALRSIRHLTVIGSPPYASRGGVTNLVSDKTWEPLTELVEKLSHIKTLSWDFSGPVPLTLLNVLHKKHPRAQLRVLQFYRPSRRTDHKNKAELALSTSPLLTVFKADIRYDFNMDDWDDEDEDDDDEDNFLPDTQEAACQRIIANAPNLRHASVIANGHAGFFHDLAGFNMDQNTKFFTHTQPNNSLRTLTLDGYAMTRRTLEDWGRFVDIASLDSLNCLRGYGHDEDYFSLASDLLRNLKTVSLNFSYRQADWRLAAAANTYFATCAPIETLSLWGWHGIVTLDNILRHGPSLKDLQLHERESIDLHRPRALLSKDDVHRIRTTCPTLESFTMDIDRAETDWRDEQENEHIYRELALLGDRLEKVQLYFNLGLAAAYQEGSANAWYQGDRTLETLSSRDNHLINEVDTTLFPLHTQPSAHAPYPPPAVPRLLDGVNLATPPDAEPRKKTPLPLPKPAEHVAQLKHIWTTIFGHRRAGARALDVKIGEWERKQYGGRMVMLRDWERSRRSLVKIRPHERDDMQGRAVMRALGGWERKGDETFD